MNKYEYQIRISKLSEQDGGGYVAIVPELPGCMSDGETYEEALNNIQDAIKGWIETAEFRGQRIPDPIIYQDEEEFSGKLVIRIPKALHKELKVNAEQEGISLNQLILYYLSRQAGIQEVISEPIDENQEISVIDQKRNIPELKNINNFFFVSNTRPKDWDILNISNMITER
jgi:antitoxin HicB